MPAMFPRVGDTGGPAALKRAFISPDCNEVDAALLSRGDSNRERIDARKRTASASSSHDPVEELFRRQQPQLCRPDTMGCCVAIATQRFTLIFRYLQIRTGWLGRQDERDKFKVLIYITLCRRLSKSTARIARIFVGCRGHF